MITDISTIIWKEARELFLQRPNFRGGWMGLVVMLLVFGVMLPLQSGPEWVTSPLNLAIWAWVPYLLVSGVVADSIAGERERHTLETLLASRLSDQAILFGKIAASMIYGWGLTMVSVLISLVTINVAHWEGEPLLFPAGIFLGILGLSFLVSLMAAGLGVLVSLKAATVRQAQQIFNVVFLLLFIPLFAFPLLPEKLQSQVTRWLMNADVTAITLAVSVFLLVLNIVLLAIAMARFRRSRLILD